MTGLDVENDAIIEIFCVITDANLNVLDDQGWGAVIHQPKERMDKMVFISLLRFSLPSLQRVLRLAAQTGRMVHTNSW